MAGKASLIQDIYSLTPLQEGMLFHHMIDSASGDYIVQTTFKLDFELNEQKFIQALELLSAKYDVLRTAVIYEKMKVPKQVVFKQRKINFQVFDYSALSEEEAEERSMNDIMNDRAKGFDIQKETLIRFIYSKMPGSCSKITYVIHHIIIDGWSDNIINEKIMEYYGMLVKGIPYERVLAQIKKERRYEGDYKNYINWIQEKKVENALRYWKELLEDFDGACEIKPLLGEPPTGKSNSLIARGMPDEAAQKLIKLSRETDFTLNAFFRAAVGILLHIYTGTHDTVFDNVVSGRNADIPGISNMVGLFLNTILVRVQANEGMTVRELVEQQQLQSVESTNYDFCSLAEIQKNAASLSSEKKLLYVYENYSSGKEEVPAEASDDNSTMEMGLDSSEEQTNYDINLIFSSGHGVGVKVMYSGSRYTEYEIGLLADRLINILCKITENLDAKVADITCDNEEPLKKQLAQFNDTYTDYPRDKTVVDLFEEQAEKTPDKTVLVFEGQTLTYRELNLRANAVAYKLRELGVQPDDFVAIIADKSCEMIAGINGILKAGGAYVPIDPTYPEDRIVFMLEDCNPKAILKFTKENISLPDNIPTVDLGEITVCERDYVNPEKVNKPTDAVYCIYTSGTTGNPKGVVVEHRNVVKLVINSDFTVLNDKTVILQTGQLMFDASTFEIWGAELNGGTLHLINKDVLLNAASFKKYMVDNGINTMFITTALFCQFINEDETIFDCLEHLMFGGEAASERHVKILRSRNKKLDFRDGYGPTETTTFATHYIIDKELERTPIGKPISNTQVYIMNGNKLCGVGIPGELCIAGDGVGRGYLNRPELTQQKFTANPFGEGRMYHSGDLARWMADGNIEYMGRFDDQVKIRGFRIELGEIENRIKLIDRVKGCAVIVKADSTGEKAIYAYYTCEQEISIPEIKAKLAETVPPYMIPSYMMKIDSIPLTRNGKLDKRSLPDIEAKSTKEYVAPTTEMQSVICETFCEVLGLDKVGIKDGFFEMGGHSLRATRLVNIIEAKTGVKIALKDVFSHSTPEQLAALVDGTTGEEYQPIPKAEVKEYYPMSSTQKRTYLIQQLDPEAMTYNMPYTMKMSGEMRSEQLKSALQKMIERHEILRTAFITVDGEPVQKIMETVESDFEYNESSEPDEKLAEEYFKPFDLSKPPLVRVKLVNKGSYHLFMMDTHHIVSDGMSRNIFIKELTALYRGQTLEPLTRQYKDYSEWMRTRDLSGQAEYWKKQFEDEIPVLDMPLDFVRPQVQSHKGSTVLLVTDEDVSAKIKKLSEKTGATDYMIFLAALMVTLSKYSRQEDIVIGSPISGRTHKDTESMLGMFVNTLAMRGYPEAKKTFEQFLKEIKDLCLNSYENQEYPFEELVEAVKVQRDMSRNPLFDVMLVMQNNEKTNADVENIDVDSADIESAAIAKFDMNYNVVPLGSRYGISLEYCTALFTKETAHRILDNYACVLKNAVENMTCAIGDIEMLIDSDSAQILGSFNETYADYNTEYTLAELFERQAEKTPDNTAVVFENQSITYAELNKRANVLAHKLRSLGAKPNDFAAIIADRSIEQICGVYGIVKSGAAYVPIDPTYPEERISYMLKDSKPTAVLKYTAENIELPDDITVIDLSDEGAFSGAQDNPTLINKPDDAAYCIYTSGTSGEPKGVILENRSVVNHLSVMRNRFYSSGAEGATPLFTSFAFDFVVPAIFGTMLYGDTLAVMKDINGLSEYSKNNKLAVVKITPSYFNGVHDLFANQNGQVGTIVFGGETLTADTIKNVYNAFGSGIRIFNEYGPTEATVFTSVAEVSGSEKVTIGKPVENSHIYIMNGDKLCGIGVPGELCISGIGVARGYLNRDELTAEKFVESPFDDSRMYRSGDLARWLPDGNIEYLGRIDDQVKIRGFRVELGEIEIRIRAIEGIKDCAVVAKADSTGDKAVYAYYTGETEISAGDIKDKLSGVLPNYMIPAYMMQLESIPVTKNGKLDKRALPEIDARAIEEYIAPRTATEKIICDIFAEILNSEQVGVKDSFFEMGGHSLRATRLVNFIEEQTGARITLREVFLNSTPEALAQIADSRSGKAYEAIPKAEEKEYYPMSSTQKRMYLIQQMMPESIVYNMPFVMTMSGQADPERLREALRQLIQRHEILRTAFLDIDGELVQKVLDDFNEDFEYVTSDEPEDKLKEEFYRPFDLSKPPIMRLKLVNRGDHHLLMFDTHHIITDGMSDKTIAREITALYNGEALPPLTRQYKDYSEWMRTRDLTPQANYWKEQFSDEAPVLDLPLDFARPQVQSYEGMAVRVFLEKSICDSIKALSAKTGATDYMVFLAALMVMLSKYSRQEDIVIGTPMSGRVHRDTEQMLGMFVNTLAMRGYPEGGKTFEEFLSEIKEVCLNAYENQEYPFEELVEAVKVRRDMSRNPLFDVLMVLQNNEQDNSEIKGLDVENSTDNVLAVSRFDMTYSIIPVGDRYGISLEFCTALFREETAKRMLESFEQILKNASADSTQKISDIEMISDSDKEKILGIFNDTKIDYPENKTIVEMFEEQVSKTPDKTAVVYEESSLTYSQLNARVNTVAYKLREIDIRPGDFVAVLADKSLEMIYGIFGVLKSGGAYLPIDPTYPEGRIQFMLEDCAPKAVIVYTKQNVKLPDSMTVINLEDIEFAEGIAENPEHVNNAHDPAYCIYTSGTTGKPKGVVVEHYGVANYREYFVKIQGINEKDNVIQFASIAFDATVAEITMGLLTGAAMHIISPDVQKDPKKFEKYTKDNNITFGILPPPYLAQLNLTSFRTIMTAGSETNSRLVRENSHIPVYSNDYGPTEVTVCASFWKHDSSEPIPDKIPIGRPINNKQIYIMNGNKLCGIGVPGELCIAGVGIARGYLNRPELTAEKFVKNPFGEGRMYRSGDLARWLPDGNIEYLGRIDEQVKIRGFRVELGEIESKIREIENINDCAVIARADSTGDKAIYAYFTSDTQVNVSDIRERLGETLPNYMIPSYMMQIESIPVTKNGKLDKRALPEIEAQSSNEYAAPRTEAERMICGIFAEILNAKQVGIKDGFFELGGHSLRATKLVNAIEEQTGVKIALKDVFIHTTPEEIASIVHSRTGEVYAAIPKAEEKDYYPMSSTQRRTYLIQQLEPDSTAYNMPFSMKMTGEVYPDKLKAALQSMIDRHEILRTALMTIDGEPVQKVLDHVDAVFEYALSDEPDEKLIGEYFKPFDLSCPPFVRVKLVNKGDYHLFIMDMHHIITDGMSQNIFISELTALYNGEELEPLTVQYKDYSEWMRTRDISSQANYWKEQFAEEAPILDMPTDYVRPQIQSYVGASVSALTDEQLSMGIKAIAEKTGATDYMIFLAALMVTLSKYSRQDDVVIGSPISGRTHRDTEKMLGMFVNTLAMRGYPSSEKTFAAFLDEIKQTCLNAYENQEYPFEELVEAINIRRDLSRNPLFDVMLTMQNNEQAKAELEDNVEMESSGVAASVAAKFDMSFDVMKLGSRYGIALQFCTALFTEDTAKRVVEHLTEVLKAAADNINISIGNIQMITDEERSIIENKFNDTKADYPKDKTVVDLLEEKAAAVPERTAVKFDGTNVTFAQLNARANRLGNSLRSRGIGTNDFVLLIAERSNLMLEAIYGILKSGGAYVPVDPNTPDERIKFMAQDCSAKAIVTCGTSISFETDIDVIRYEDISESSVSDENPEKITDAKDLAYIIYTSGTTGMPKGVMIEHKGLVNLLSAYEKIYGMTENDVVLQFASYCFDQSVWDIFSIVWNGNAVCAIPADYVRNPEKLAQYMKAEGITLTSLTPAYINILDPKDFSGLRLLDSSGEAGNLETLRKWRKAGKRVINTYGPTEVTVNTSSYEVFETSDKLPIGTPIDNLQTYITDGEKLCGIGVPGELCIAGDGVARGYLNRPELTEEKFVDNPFGKGRMYRSGDLARWLPDGNIEYLGRIDEQVKIRGFRIELGEIESRIRAVDSVTDCAVIARADSAGDKAIYAYYTSDAEISVSEIREKLAKTLPGYMIPAYMMQIESIPVTRNGKLDKRALPEIEAKASNKYAAPRSEAEKIICKIFSEILNVEQVGITDGFFELGGHSLRATRLVNSIEEQTGVKIALKDVFVHSTPEELAAIVESREGERYEAIPKAEEKEYYPMSSTQKRTYLIWQLEQNSTVYNMPFNMKMTGEVYPDKLKEALQAMLDRHEILRTAFLTVNGEPVQKILDRVEAEFEYETSSEPDENIIGEFIKPFDLRCPPLVRVKLVNKGEYHLFLMDTHHIVSDGMSENIFIEELTALYNGQTLEPLAVQYKDYSEWMYSRDMSRQKSFWKEQFKDEAPALDMPLDFVRPQLQSYDGSAIAILTDEETSQAVKALSRRTGATEYMIFLAALMVTLSKYSRQDDIVIGSPISGRTHRDTEKMLGMFVNTLGLRGYPEGGKTFEEFLGEIKNICLNAYENQEYPFEELVEEVTVRRDMSRNPLFDVLMVMQNNEQLENEVEGVEAEQAAANKSTIAKFDMTYNISPYGSRYAVAMEFCTALFRLDTAKRILDNFEIVLKSAVTNSAQKISDIEMLSEEDRRIILEVFNNTSTDYPRDKTVAALFEEQAAMHPDNTALAFEGERLTYNELNEKANIIAHKLRELGVKPDDFVAIIADRSFEMIAAILGIVKSGGAYVPIDPTYPQARITFILEDCMPKAVLRLTEDDIAIPQGLPIIDLSDSGVWTGDTSNPEPVGTENDLVYCIYTSGTTGKPKGSLIEQKSVLRLVKNTNYIRLDENTVILQTGSMSFDASTFEVWGALLNGGKLVITVQDVITNNVRMRELMNRENVNTMWLTSTLFNQMIMEENDMFDSLSHLLIGGEKLSDDHVRIMKGRNNGVILTNGYGPTENTTFTTTYDIPAEFEKIPIGKPIANTKIYIMDNGHLCGIGVPGELCTAGNGVARGYLNRDELTKEKFVENPFGEGRMYKTGDLARWLPDGNIEFIGRIDDQVKIRGFRIEPGEVASRIREIEFVRDCAVIVKADSMGDKAIYAYVTGDSEIDIAEIRERLSASLPNYMIPAYMMQIDSIPVTSNGKLDKRALPEIEAKAQNDYEAPRTNTERIICEAFEQILNTEKVGIHDGFFELGGHSLRATRLINAIEEKTGVKIALKDVFVHTTPEELAAIVDSRTGEVYEEIPRAEEKEYYPMSSTQKRMYLIHKIDPESTAYNMPFTLMLPEDIKPEQFESALAEMIKRHEILRTEFLTVDGEPVQRILDELKPDFERFESDKPDEVLSEEFSKPFDLSKPPLVRIRLVKKQDYYLFLLDMHHIISDGMSVNNFVNEYTALCSGEKLEPPKRQYKDYSEWMRTRDLSAQENYWKEQFRDEAPVLDMPLDFARPSMQSFAGASISIFAPQEIADGVKRISERTGTTEYMIFLAALMVMLSRYSRQDDIVIGSPISGRTHKDTEKMLGMFVNTLAMRGYPAGEKTFEEFLYEIKQTCLNAYENQEYPFEELVEAVTVRRDTSRNPLFDVLMAMQNNEKSFESDPEEDNSGKAQNEVYTAQGDAVVDLAFNVSAENNTYVINMQYCTDLFKPETAQNMIGHYVQVLKVVASDICVKLENISLASQQERDVILNEFNNTYSDYPRDKTLVDLIEEQVAEHPERVAIVCEDESLSYAQMNDISNAIAHRLISEGVKAGDRVALSLDKGLKLPAVVIGVLKTGAAYTPIDSTLPAERIRAMLSDIAPVCILTADGCGYEDYDFKNININDESIYAERYENPNVGVKPENDAYIMYTSGTTGVPKGIIISHKAIMADINNMVRTYGVNENTVHLQHGAYTFDLFVEEVYPTLCMGGHIAVMSKEILLNIPWAHKYIRDNNVTIVHMTPMLLSEFNKYEWSSSVKTFIVGGEKVKVKHIAPLLDRECSIFQDYGPTENTVIASVYRVKSEHEKLVLDENWDIPIGHPKFNTNVYIMDGDNLCGIGVPGEICIAGDSLAKGYLNLPELTAEKFVDNPFGEGKMYRSGDLARWLPDGNLEFIGRIDEQVKIRGIRIELGEIESKLREIDGILDCAVVAKDDKKGEKAIFAYFIGSREINVSQLRSILSGVLPDYMVPAYMMQIDVLPQNRNGKLDVRALPEIEAKAYNAYVQPRNAAEEILCNIFSEVLNVEKVGVKDGFFELGGHSLRATRLINAVEEQTGIKLALKDIFIHTTPEELAAIVESQTGGLYESIPRAEEKEYYPMSSTQKRTYLIWQLEPMSTAYNMPFSMKMTGEVYPDKLREALQGMIDRHEILRTAFLTVDGEPVQKILDRVEAEFEYVTSSENDDKLIDEYFKPFDLNCPPFVRVKLVNKGDYHLFLMDMHHIITDGMSQNLFIGELTALYNGEKLEPLSHQYKDYSEWMRTRDLTSQENYWKEQFKEEAPVLDMPTDYVRPLIQSYLGKTISTAIDEQLSQGIKHIAEQTGTTEYMIFLAALMVTLSKYSRQDDIVIGSPISGRTHRDTEKMLGMFINTLAMRGYPSSDKTLSQFLDEIKEICLNAYENQDYPFEELVEAVNVRRDTSRNPLFDVLMVMQNNEETKAEVGNVEFSGAGGSESAVSKFDMTYIVVPSGDRFMISLEYCTALFKSETAQRVLTGFTEVLKSFAENRGQKISDVDMITERERSQILDEFNDTITDYKADTTLAKMFDEQVKKTPDNTAVVFGNASLSFAELDNRANIIANKLQSLGAKPNEYAAVIADRSIEMICAVYGVVKSGAAYVPIDPTYPAERISYMINDCKPKAVLKYTAEDVLLPDDVAVIDLSCENAWSGNSDSVVNTASPNSAAYCIYTSGTSGEPKGVIIENKSVVNHLNVMRNHFYNENNQYSAPLFTSFAFDFVVPAIFGTILYGDTLAVMSDINGLSYYSRNNKLAVLKITPSYFNSIYGIFNNHKSQVETIVFGGESLTEETVENVRTAFGSDTRIFNEYGPTEATVFTSVAEVYADKPVTIGKPVENSHIYIMNGDSLCGIGVPGELCITGTGVARGYLNRPQLTEEKFVENPFGEGRMYRSGDLARWLSDGSIEYLGRIDDQVKIRGYRVELLEIEIRIRAVEDIKDCAVIARPDSTGEKAIFAYYVSDRDVSAADVKAKLADVLPNYMVPTYMMQIERIPVTQNGKLDRRALPEIELERIHEYVPAETENQKLLCDIISSLLGIEKVGITDNFFDLGGTSLKALQILNKLREAGLRCSYHTIYNAKSVEELASKIEPIGEYENRTSAFAGMGEKNEELLSALIKKHSENFVGAAEMLRYKPLTFSKTFFDQFSNVTVSSVTVNAESDEKLKDAVRKLVIEQDVLRSAYSLVQNDLIVYDMNEFDVPIFEGKVDEFKLCEMMSKSMSLSQDVIIPSLIVTEKTESGVYNVICVLLHALSDEFSKQIFKERLAAIVNDDSYEPNTYMYYNFVKEMSQARDELTERFTDSEFYKKFESIRDSQKEMVSRMLGGKLTVTDYVVSKKLGESEVSRGYESPLETAAPIMLSMIGRQFGNDSLDRMVGINLTNCRNNTNKNTIGFFLDERPFIYDNGVVSEYDGFEANILACEIFSDYEGCIPLNYGVMGDRAIDEECISRMPEESLEDGGYFRFEIFTNGYNVYVPAFNNSIDFEYLEEYFSVEKTEVLNKRD